MIKVRTKIKNQVTHELAAACIKFSSPISDVFGKSGRHIVDGLLNGTDFRCDIGEHTFKKVKANIEKIRATIQASLFSTDNSP